MKQTNGKTRNQADTLNGRVMDVRRDSADFRDRIYNPALLQLKDEYLPDPGLLTIRDQGKEGACTGFGLAATINFLNKMKNIDEPVSERMLYEMARQHDRWPGEAYEGSSARGAMKGWHKNGVCPERDWKYRPGQRRRGDYLTEKRALAALKYPLGAYYRVLKKRSDLHAALMETGAVFVSAAVHDGWRNPRGGFIRKTGDMITNGGHAFCIIGYTEDGFLVQNSWGDRWGGVTLGGKKYEGCALWPYADYDENYWDGWVARMALPVESLSALQGGNIDDRPSGAERIEKGPPRREIENHYIHIDDGQFDPKGDYPSSDARTQELINKAVTDMSGTQDNAPGHILLYAHGGLNTVKGSAKRVSAWTKVFESNRIRQIHFIWETGLAASIKDVLLGKDNFAKQRAGGFSDWTDSILEKVTQPLGYPIWKEMTEDAEIAFKTSKDAGTRTLSHLKNALSNVPASKRPTLHMAGHSAGSIWIGHLLNRWFKMGNAPVESLQLFAPACTMDFYRDNLKPHLGASKVKSLVHYQLDDKTERDDHTAYIYRKSLLYLVSRSYQSKHDTVPLMGMEKHWDDQGHPRIVTYDTRKNSDITNSDSHGGFDNDLKTMNHLLKIILGKKPSTEFSEQDMDY